MKILQIFGAVVAVHLLAFIFIFASPGCQSGPRNIPTPDATVPGGPNLTPITYNSTPANPSPVDLVAATPVSPAGHATPTRPGSATAVAVTPPKPSVEVAPVSTYTVVRGDSLWSIAQKNSLTVAELAKANSLGVGATLQPGKKLIVPGKVAAPKDLSTGAPAGKVAATDKTAPARNGEAVKHTVQVGESLGVIARKYQVTVAELVTANSISDPSKVRAGQQLIIPGFKAVSGKGTTTVLPPKTDATEPTVTTPRFEIAPPPPGQDLDSGLKGAGTEVPTIKVEEPKADQPPGK